MQYILFAFWALLAVLFAEQFIFGFEWHILAGEWIVFMCLALYLAFACIRNGIWDRHLKANNKTNFIAALIAAAAAAVLTAGISAVRYPGHTEGSLIAGGIMFVFVFAACFGILQLMANTYKKKVAELERDPEEEI